METIQLTKAQITKKTRGINFCKTTMYKTPKVSAYDGNGTLFSLEFAYQFNQFLEVISDNKEKTYINNVKLLLESLGGIVGNFRLEQDNEDLDSEIDEEQAIALIYNGRDSVMCEFTDAGCELGDDNKYYCWTLIANAIAKFCEGKDGLDYEFSKWNFFDRFEIYITRVSKREFLVTINVEFIEEN